MVNRLVRIVRADGWQSALTALAVLVMLPEIGRQIQTGFSPLSTLLLALSTVAFASRIRFPEYALAGQLLLTVAMALPPDGPLLTGWCLTQLCLLSLSSKRERTAVIVGAVGVLFVLFGTAVFSNRGDWRALLASPYNIGLIDLSWTLMSVGVGAAVRTQRRYLLAIQDQATRALESRESEAQRRVAEERLRIARELHDAVAHHIAVVGMFTGLARTTLATSPAQAEQALARAQEATRAVLGELQQILRVLREPGDDDPGPAPDTPSAPVPGYDDITALIGSFEEIGMTVRLAVTGPRQPLSIAAGLTAYRVVQEALTNAHKHGDGAADILIDFGPATVVLEVVNRTAQPARQGTNTDGRGGFGLVGMRERVRMIGGMLMHGDEGETYRVRVELPLGDLAVHQPASESALR